LPHCAQEFSAIAGKRIITPAGNHHPGSADINPPRWLSRIYRFRFGHVPIQNWSPSKANVRRPLEPKDIPEGAANLPIVIGLRLACSGQLERCLHVSL
jgi:hypothetical protein